MLEDPANMSKETDSSFTLTAGEGSAAVSVKGSVYTITGGGEYTAEGRLEEGQIIIDAGDDGDVRLVLNNVSINSSQAAPVVAVNASKVTLQAEKDTYNVITDSRTGDPGNVPESEENYDAAVYAACDITVGGRGTLIVNATYDNGIKTKDDLTVKNLTLKVTAAGNALKGNDSVTVKSGDLMLISTGSDGIKTEESGISAKGNQKGTVSIEGGQVDVYAACDGISAGYNVEISAGETETVVNIFTSTYSENTGEVSGGSELYLILPTSLYSENSDYYAYVYDGADGSSKYVRFTHETMVSSGRTRYYGLSGKVPGNFSKIVFIEVPEGGDPAGDEVKRKSSGEDIDGSMNGYLVTGTSSLDGKWVQLTKNGNGSNKTSYSSKGIKAANEVKISGGTVNVKCMDGGIHANADGTLENGSAALGRITVSGGRVTVTAADDGMHADGELVISGGCVNIAEAHEGLEANVITIEGGDTDGIDSNGSFEMTGGTVLITGGASQGTVAGSVDVERNLSVTGGTIVAFGGVCETPGSGSFNVYITSGTFAAGDYVLAEKDGSNLLSWTQDSQKVGSSGGGFGPGGFGPGGRR